MVGNHRWTIGLTTCSSLLGLAVSSGLAILAHHLVDELSHPHKVIDEAQFSFDLPRTVAEPPQALRRSLAFQASDGTFLRGEFWAQPEAAPTIILCHGYRISSSILRPAAALEYQYGYNILLFDFRGHGESESVITSGGIAEVRDLEAAITAATRQPEVLPGKIIIQGFSMGASIALLTPPHPDVAAIIADSPYARLDDILRRYVHYRLTSESNGWRPSLRQLRLIFPAIAWAVVVASSLDFRIRFGHSLFARPDLSFKRWRERRKNLRQVPILLIHGEADETIPIQHAHTLAAAAQASGTPLETYFVPQAEHCGAYSRDPERYVSLLRTFASRHLKLEQSEA
jgi:uncharacterized protein